MSQGVDRPIGARLAFSPSVIEAALIHHDCDEKEHNQSGDDPRSSACHP